jgi:hypothetical protein
MVGMSNQDIGIIFFMSILLMLSKLIVFKVLSSFTTVGKKTTALTKIGGRHLWRSIYLESLAPYNNTLG